MNAKSKPMIIIPAFNEADCIGGTISLIRNARVNVLILVIDDGSTDRTAEIAKSLGAEVLRFTENKGKAFAFISGVKHVFPMHPSAVISLDADMLRIDKPGIIS